MCETWVCDHCFHSPIECGFLRAYSLTALGETDALKSIILLADHAADCPSITLGSGPLDAGCPTAMQGKARTAANDASADDISIYVMSFNQDSLPVNRNRLRALTRGRGFFSESDDASDLPDMMASIALDIPIALVQ